MASNFKTYIFMGVVTLISSLLLSYSYSSLKKLTKENIEFDIKRNIIKSVGYSITTMSKDDINANYDANITEMILDKNNKILSGVLWSDLVGVEDRKNGLTYFVNKSDKIKFNMVENKDTDTSIKSYLPIFFHSDKQVFVIPISGKGLWSTLFGFIAIGKDGNTVKGIAFYNHKETPGLGGEVDKKWFQNNFIGKKIFKDDRLVSVKVIKGTTDALSATEQNHAVDGITGATITSKGLSSFLLRDLARYENFLRNPHVK